LANPVFQYIISGVLQGEEYISDIISMIFHVLTFKSKMAAVSDLENQFIFTCLQQLGRVAYHFWILGV